MALALVFFNRALKLAKTGREKKSIQLKIANAPLEIGKRLLNPKQPFFKPKRSKKEAAVDAKERIFFLEGSMDFFTNLWHTKNLFKFWVRSWMRQRSKNKNVLNCCGIFFHLKTRTV